ncbi:hypothetical protein [Gordonia sp. NPDC003422]
MINLGFDYDSNMAASHQIPGLNPRKDRRDRIYLKFMLKNFSALQPIAGWSVTNPPTWRDLAYVARVDRPGLFAALSRWWVTYLVAAPFLVLGLLILLGSPTSPGALLAALIFASPGVALLAASVLLGRGGSDRFVGGTRATKEAALRRVANLAWTSHLAPGLGMLDVSHGWNPSRRRYYEGMRIAYAEKGSRRLPFATLLNPALPASEKVDLAMVIPIPPGSTRPRVMQWGTEVLAPAIGAARVVAIGHTVGAGEGHEHVKLRLVFQEQPAIPSATLSDLRKVLGQAPDNWSLFAGMSMERTPVWLDMGSHMLIGATTGAGKTVTLHALLAQLRLRSCDTHYADLKNGDGSKSYAALESLCSATGSIQGLWSQADHVNNLMSERYATLARLEMDGAGEAEIEAERVSWTPTYLVVDEIGLLEKSSGAKSPEEAVKADLQHRLLRNVAQRGRGALVFLILIGQKINADVVPMHVQKNCKTKLVMKIDDEWTIESLIAGTADTISQAKADLMTSQTPRGFGYLSAEGHQTVALRTVWMDEVTGDVRRALQELGPVPQTPLPALSIPQIAERVADRGADSEIDPLLASRQGGAEPTTDTPADLREQIREIADPTFDLLEFTDEPQAEGTWR